MTRARQRIGGEVLSALLEQTRTHNDLYYVGPREKEEFTAHLNRRLKDRKLEGLVKNLFRPSYGGNRNVTLMYTLGGLMVSSDDDMRPYALVEASPESLVDEEVSRGKLFKAADGGFTRKSFDILTSFVDVLGKPVREIPDNYERGELLVDTSMDLETNASTGLSRENSLMSSAGGGLRRRDRSRWPRTYRSGHQRHRRDRSTVDMFLEWTSTRPASTTFNERYVPGQLPTGGDQQEESWRMDFAAWLGYRQHRWASRRSSRPGFRPEDLRSPALGPARRDRRGPRRRRADAHQEQLLCGTRRPPRFFNEEGRQPSSSGRSRARSRGPTT